LSTLFVFRRKYYRFNGNIQDCFSLKRKGRLSDTVHTRPWANGLHRLISERQGLKKGQLAKLAAIRSGFISVVANAKSDKNFEVQGLQRLADGFTKFDRLTNPHAPAVEIWEFFVTDEQSALLRDRASKAQADSEDAARTKRALEIGRQLLDMARREEVAPAPPLTAVESVTPPVRARRKPSKKRPRKHAS